MTVHPKVQGQGPSAAFEKALLDMLRRSALFRTLARAFATPDAASSLERELSALCRMPELPVELAAALRAAAVAWRACSAEERAAAYVRFFSTDQRCPLHETAYGDANRLTGKSAELADLQGFYRAFAVSLQQERADHLSVELEFYSTLLFKEAWARAEGWKEQASVTRSAARQFLADHLGRWLGALEREMGRQNVPPPYPQLARATAIAVESEVRRLRVHVTPCEGRRPVDSMQADRFECGLMPEGDGGVQSRG